MWPVYLCIGFSLGLAVASIIVWFRNADPTRWTREDQHRLMKEEMHKKCPKQSKYEDKYE